MYRYLTESKDIMKIIRITGEQVELAMAA